MDPRRQFRTTAKYGIPFVAMMAGICILGLFGAMDAEAKSAAGGNWRAEATPVSVLEGPR